MSAVLNKCILRLILMVAVALAVKGAAENTAPFRHDASTIVSVYHPLSPTVKRKMAKRFKNFIDHYERTIERSKGLYKAEIPAGIGVKEWDGFKYIYLLIKQTNDVRLVLGDENNILVTAPGSTPGIMTDRTLFCGPHNAGICFYYQATSNELRTIVSPLGLQKIINFRRLKDFSTPDVFNDLPELSIKQDLFVNSVTNFSWYINNKASNDNALSELHNNKIRKAYGTYVLDDKEFFKKLIFRNVDKWYLVIKSEMEVYWIEEVDNQLFYVLGSRPGKIDEIFLSFGEYKEGTSLLYKTTDQGISVVFNYAMGFYDDINVLEDIFLELDKKGLFQRKLFFKRTESIPSKSFPVRSRTPLETFFE